MFAYEYIVLPLKTTHILWLIYVYQVTHVSFPEFIPALLINFSLMDFSQNEPLKIHVGFNAACSVKSFLGSNIYF